jgi:hypothetical protein
LPSVLVKSVPIANRCLVVNDVGTSVLATGGRALKNMHDRSLLDRYVILLFSFKKMSKTPPVNVSAPLVPLSAPESLEKIEIRGACAFCHRPEASDLKLLRCAACKVELYCSKDHQKSHWSEHKALCKARKTGIVSVPSQIAPTNLKVIICGGGVIGVCIAYYLTLLGVRPTLVERSSPNIQYF